MTKTKKTEAKQLNCKHCTENFHSFEERRLHAKDFHTKKRYHCNICECTFFDKKFIFDTHKLTCFKSNFFCHICKAANVTKKPHKFETFWKHYSQEHDENVRIFTQNDILARIIPNGDQNPDPGNISLEQYDPILGNTDTETNESVNNSVISDSNFNMSPVRNDGFIKKLKKDEKKFECLQNKVTNLNSKLTEANQRAEKAEDQLKKMKEAFEGEKLKREEAEKEIEKLKAWKKKWKNMLLNDE